MTSGSLTVGLLAAILGVLLLSRHDGREARQAEHCAIYATGKVAPDKYPAEGDPRPIYMFECLSEAGWDGDAAMNVARAHFAR